MRDVTTVTDRKQLRDRLVDAPPGARTPVVVSGRVEEPFDAYRRARDGPGGAYLETTGGQSGWGYFGVDPVDRLTVWPDATVRTPTEADGVAGFTGGTSVPALAALQARLDAETLIRGDCPVPYPCGGIGWLSYDLARDLETIPATTTNDRGLPRLEVAFFDRLAAWSEPRDGSVTLYVTACPTVAADDNPDAVYDRGRERALELIERIHTGDPSTATPPRSATTMAFESDCGRAAFADRVQTIKDHIAAGDTFQTNVCHRLSAPAAVHPVAAFDALREVNPAPYSGLLEFPGATLVSASPELLLERVGDRLRTEPIAGTRPRGATDAEDRALAADLREDAKERAEHAMLVDLERNDLGKVATYGSVAVEEYRRIDRYAEVMHLVSEVTARLRSEATLADAIAALFPGGTITGAPKPETMALIDRVETTRRGPYTGSIGLFGFDDRATLNIIIRTLVAHEGAYHLRVGAGVVHDSVPDREYDETLDKGRALIDAIDTALGDRASMTLLEES